MSLVGNENKNIFPFDMELVVNFFLLVPTNLMFLLVNFN